MEKGIGEQIVTMVFGGLTVVNVFSKGRENLDGMLSRWAGVCAWGEGKSVASLFVWLTGVKEGKMMVGIDGV